MARVFRPSQKIDSERNRQIATERASGASLVQLAEKHGVSRATICRVSQAFGVKPPPAVPGTSVKVDRKAEARRTAEAVQRYLLGEPVHEIAAALGIREKSVYTRVNRVGASRTRKPRDPWDIVSARIVFASGCWMWLGAHNRKGYAVASIKDRPGWYFAHRAIYEMLIGPIAPGMTVDHLCRERGCVNPYHMDVCSPLENFRRGISGTPNYKVGLWR